MLLANRLDEAQRRIRPWVLRGTLPGPYAMFRVNVMWRHGSLPSVPVSMTLLLSHRTLSVIRRSEAAYTSNAPPSEPLPVRCRARLPQSRFVVTLMAPRVLVKTIPFPPRVLVTMWLL